MSNDDDYAPDEEAGRALVEEFQNNARLSAERVKYDPWQREYRRVAAEVERTTNAEPIRVISRVASPDVV